MELCQSREKAADAACREDGDVFAMIICKFVRKQSLLWNVVEITHHRRNHQWAKELAANVGFLPWPPDCGRKKLHLFPPLHLLFPDGVHLPISDPRKGADQASP
ncbi:hypothetical protein R6Z07M_004548 [Ovis aries]